MLNSLKSKFIISFFIIEIIFFTMIANINFNSIENVFMNLTDEKINITGQLLSELIKTPLIIYDLATIDDIVKNFSTVKNVIAIQIEESDGSVLSSYINKKKFPKDMQMTKPHDHKTVKTYKDKEYINSFVEVKVDKKTIGHIHFVFSTVDNLKSIEKNKELTYLTIVLALIIGFIISFVIGNYLDKSLKLLIRIAKNVAEDEEVIIPYNPQSKDEIGKLFSTMYIMQKLIRERTQNLNTSINDLQQYIIAIDHSAIVSKTNIHGVITYVNPKFCEVTGYRKNELLGKTHAILRDPDIDDSFFKNMWETISSKKIFHDTFRNIKKNKEYFYVDATIVPLLDNNGDISEYIAIRYEATEIIDAKNRAIAAKKVKEEFLSNMSHEIRTPMNAILGFVKLLQKNTTDEKSLSYLNTIDSSSKLLLHIINDILDFSKIESGKLIIDKHPFNPKIELEDTVKLFSIMLKEKSITLVINSDKSFPDCLEGDVVRIKQIIFNFLSNALKFTQKNKHIYIDQKYDHIKNIFSVSVKDEGIGISKEQQSKIFNAFEQADGSTTRKFGGTGLGLSISNKLAHLMNGEITMYSKRGEGSTFTLSLPLKSCEKESASYDKTVKEKALQDTQFVGNILVAEDNKTNQMLIKILLNDHGVTYTIAEDGVEAVNIYKNSKFDLILMDENMPNMTGSEAFRKIREHEDENKLSHTPVIALTANVMQEDVNKFIDMGMDDFLAKPLETDELKRVLNKFLNN